MNNENHSEYNIKSFSEIISIPLANFITFTCCGTWLHGNKKGSVDRNHNIPHTKFLTQNKQRHLSAQLRLVETPYLLDTDRREIALKAIVQICADRNWMLFAAHVRTNHVHVVVHARVKLEFVLTAIKSFASHYLNKAGIDNNRSKRWTRHGSTRYLWRIEAVDAAIHYVVHEQGNPMAVFENHLNMTGVIHKHCR